MNTVRTIRRAEELKELYVSTVAEQMIDSQIERVKTAVMNEDDLAWQFVLDLSEFCDTLEKEIND